VGRRVLLGNTDVLEDPHLLELDDDCTVADAAALQTLQERGNGYAVSGVVRVGKRGVVGVRAVAQPGTSLADGSVLMPSSSADAAAAVCPDDVYLGVPSRRALDRYGLPGDWKTPWAPGSALYQLLVGCGLQGALVPLASAFLTLMVILLAGYPGLLFMMWAMSADGAGWSVLGVKLAMPFIFALFYATLLTLVLLQKWTLGNYRPGWKLTLRGPAFYLRSFTLALQTFAAASAFETLRGSVFAPLYLRLLGAKIHPTAFVNTLQVGQALPW
jgi:hypothetical protein